jgi:hypothetical protein
MVDWGNRVSALHPRNRGSTPTDSSHAATSSTGPHPAANRRTGHRLNVGNPLFCFNERQHSLHHVRLILNSRAESGPLTHACELPEGYCRPQATYGLPAIALPIYLKRNHHLTNRTLLLSIATTLAMLLALAGTLYPVPERPYNWLPYVYLAYILCGMAWFAISIRKQP